MKNKKLVIIFIIILIIVSILAGIYKIMTSYMINRHDKIEIVDGENKLVNHLKNIEDNHKQEEQVKLFLESGDITEQEAKEILEK